MDFGLTLPNFHYGAPPGREHILGGRPCRGSVRLHLGLASDHILVGSAYPRYGTLYEALSTLAWVAAKTERLKVGTSILVLPMRHALLAAKQIATIDDLSEGRVMSGLGAGWNKQEFELVGANFSRRGRVLDESIRAMRTLWTAERPSFAGEFYRFEDSLFFPKPAQPGGPPIWIGGNSDAAITSHRHTRRRVARRRSAARRVRRPRRFAQPAASAAGREVAATIRYTVDMNLAMGTPAPAAAPDSGVGDGHERVVRRDASVRRALSRDRRDQFHLPVRAPDGRAARRRHSRLWPRDHRAPVGRTCPGGTSLMLEQMQNARAFVMEPGAIPPPIQHLAPDGTLMVPDAVLPTRRRSTGCARSCSAGASTSAASTCSAAVSW